MVNGVKGLGGVEKEDETLGTVFDPSKEVVVDTDSVIHPVLSGKKALLSWVNQGRNSRHDDVSHGGSENTVVRVSHANRPGVRNEPGVFLRNEKEKTVIEPRGGMVAPAQLSENIEEEGCGKIGGGTPGSERDPSGPGVELLVFLIASVTDSRVGSKSASWLTVLV